VQISIIFVDIARFFLLALRWLRSDHNLPEMMKVNVLPVVGAADRTEAEDRTVIQRFFARKFCGSLATGAFHGGAWPVTNDAQQMALLRLESIVIYNLLDRGIRIGNNMTELAAITANIDWHVAMYLNIRPIALLLVPAADPAINTPTVDEYRDALWSLYAFRLSKFGVKIPADNNPIIQLSMQMVGWAAWITQAIFLENCFVTVNANEFSFREVTFKDMNQVTFAHQVLWAWTTTTPLSQAPLPIDPPASSNEDVRVAVGDVLAAFNPPPAPAGGNLANVNTFLFAGSNPGDMFRLICHIIMVISHICHVNMEPLHNSVARRLWASSKHFNFLSDNIQVVNNVAYPAHSFDFTDDLNELAVIESFVAQFPAAFV
jgi:hypothetical protein